MGCGCKKKKSGTTTTKVKTNKTNNRVKPAVTVRTIRTENQ
jgi:hypothetical protein